MSEKFDDSKNIYLDKIETPEDCLKLFEKGIFYKQNRIEDVFYKRFVLLRKKIHKVLSGNTIDDLDYDVYVNSILVDCRAIFLENTRYKLNSTLQGTYRARHLDDFAKGIDEFFNREVIKDKSLKVIIKDWVDKRLVHVDYLEPEDEELIVENISSIIDRTTLNNIFVDMLVIAKQYESVRELYGKNAGEQIEKTLSWLTSDPT